MTTYQLLEKISSPEDLRKMSPRDLPELSNQVREYLIETVSSVGGHFASSLGVVELTVALHYVLNTPRDRLIWDTGHQTYPHKIITGRREELKTVRRYGGISGFPKREESPYDTYNTGHAGTAISQMLGEAIARDRKNESYKTVAVVGDASIASGNSFEALNHGGHLQTDCLVILNDNDMSISRNVGALNQYLNRLITSPTYNRWRKFWYTLLLWMPVIGPALQLFYKKVEKSTKDFFTPGSLFSDFGFRYIGPVDGNDVNELVTVLKKALNMKGPILLHILTQKGKGYQPAEENPTRFHSVSVFNRSDGSFLEKSMNQVGFSEIVGETLAEMGEKDERIVAVTPAMIEGSGLRPFYDRFPDRVYDVGIAEQHATAFSGALASGGMTPFLCIYSTFLTRAVSQLVQDVGLMNIPVRIVVDRAGCVGPDGETHQGLFDPGIILSVPNISFYAPAHGGELKAILQYMGGDIDSPIAIRFPKASCDRSALDVDNIPDVTSKRPVVYGTGRDITVIAVGAMWDTALEVAELLREKGNVSSMIVGVRWIRPMDYEYLEQILARTERFVIIEDSYIHSSAANYILNQLSPGIRARHRRTFAFPEEYIIHGTRNEILDRYNLSAPAITQIILQFRDLASRTLVSSV